MKLRRAGVAVLVAAALLPAAAPRDADAGGGTPAAPARCTCRDGNACYHWLEAPVAAPIDPCSCPGCRANRGSCPKVYPDAWNLDCMRAGRMECFLRRHAASWRIICGDDMGKCACPGSDSASCPECANGGKPLDPARFDVVKKQIAIERTVLGFDAKFVVATSPHFYLVSDLAALKVATQTGGKRELGAHEIAHLFLQRAEIAWQDFVRVFGDDFKTKKPVAIFMNRRTKDSERMQTPYFGRADAGFVYGLRGATTPAISGGIAEAGLALDQEKEVDDDGLHVRLRTSLGHILISLWHSDDATETHLPMWAFIGAGHWLGRLPARLNNLAAFIAGEGNAPLDQGVDWMKKIAKAATQRDFPHVDTFFGFTTLSQTNLVTHMRAWTWFALFLDEDRDRFLRLLRLIREGRNQREAAHEAFGCAPDELETRWRDRVLGKRRSVAEGKADVAAPAPSTGGLADIASEPDPKTIADRIKARTKIEDPTEAAALVSLLDRPSDLVHERVVLLLARSDAEPVRAFLRGDGLAKNRGVVKAGVARILGLAGDVSAASTLVQLLADPEPDVRAQAAIALGRLRFDGALRALTRLVSDRVAAPAIAAMDALAAFGEAAADSWPPVAARLDDPRRAARTAAAECLGALGSMEAIDALIARMDKEEGRVRMDVRRALERITRDDLGGDPANWRAWWRKEKERAGGRTPERPAAPPPASNDKPRYAEPKPTFYGLKIFSKRIAFALDVSSSMSDHIAVDPEWIRKSGRDYGGASVKYDLAVAEIAATLRALDPRVEFDLITFRTDVRSWKDRPVAIGSVGVDAALSYLASQHPPSRLDTAFNSSQKTDLADALRLALGMRPGTTGRAEENAADEVFVLTDGEPTAGDITDADVLLSWFREKNRDVRLRLHVVTFEGVDVNLAFLKALADAGGGTFVAVPEAKK